MTVSQCSASSGGETMKRRTLLAVAAGSLASTAAQANQSSIVSLEPGWRNPATGVYEWRRLGARPQRATATFAEFLALERVRRSLSTDPALAAARASSLVAKMERAKREHPRGNTHLFRHQRFDVMGYGAPSGRRGEASVAVNVLLTAPLDGVNTAGWLVYEHWAGGGVEAVEWAVCGNTSLSGIGVPVVCGCEPQRGDLCPRS